MTDFSELHDELRSIAGDLLAKEVTWPLLVQAGWTGLEVPEHLGGAGATFRETAVVLREVGRAAAATGCLGALGLAAGALQALSDSPTRDGLSAALAGGSETATVVARSDSLTAAFEVESASSGWRIHGSARFVPDPSSVLLLLAREPSGEPVIVAVPADTAGLTVTPQPVVDETRTLVAVDAADVTVEPAALLRVGEKSSLELWQARAATAVALDSLGVAEAMLERTVTYVGMRAQFGRALGSFQAVKHACADMLVQCEVGRQLVELAVDAVASSTPDALLAAARAKAFTTEAAVEITGKALQLHGGIGYTWESGVHVYLKRATLNRSLFGSPAAHRRLVARQLL